MMKVVFQNGVYTTMDKMNFKVTCKLSFPAYKFEKYKEYTAEIRERSIGILHEEQQTWFNFYRSDVELWEDEILAPKFNDYFEITELKKCIDNPVYFISHYTKVKELESSTKKEESKNQEKIDKIRELMKLNKRFDSYIDYLQFDRVLILIKELSPKTVDTLEMYRERSTLGTWDEIVSCINTVDKIRAYKPTEYSFVNKIIGTIQGTIMSLALNKIKENKPRNDNHKSETSKAKVQSKKKSIWNIFKKAS